MKAALIAFCAVAIVVTHLEEPLRVACAVVHSVQAKNCCKSGADSDAQSHSNHDGEPKPPAGSHCSNCDFCKIPPSPSIVATTANLRAVIADEQFVPLVDERLVSDIHLLPSIPPPRA